MSLDRPGLRSTGAETGAPPVVDAPTAATSADQTAERPAVPAHAARGNGSADRPAEPKPRKPAKPAKPGRKRLRARKVQRIVRKIDPWSVLKLSLLFYFCLFLMFLVASVALWSVGRSTGVVDDVEGFISELGTFGTCEDPATLPRGTEFVEDEGCSQQDEGYVLVGGFEFVDGRLLQAVVMGGLVLVLAGATANVLLAVLFNLMSDVTGGVRLTVLEEERPRPAKRAASPPSEPVPGSQPADANR